MWFLVVEIYEYNSNVVVLHVLFLQFIDYDGSKSLVNGFNRGCNARIVFPVPAVLSAYIDQMEGYGLRGTTKRFHRL
jgi:hypothetical protein